MVRFLSVVIPSLRAARICQKVTGRRDMFPE